MPTYLEQISVEPVPLVAVDAEGGEVTVNRIMAAILDQPAPIEVEHTYRASLLVRNDGPEGDFEAFVPVGSLNVGPDSFEQPDAYTLRWRDRPGKPRRCRIDHGGAALLDLARIEPLGVCFSHVEEPADAAIFEDGALVPFDDFDDPVDQITGNAVIRDVGRDATSTCGFVLATGPAEFTIVPTRGHPGSS